MDEHEDPELDLEAATAEFALRERLSAIDPADNAAEAVPASERLAEIRHAIEVAWPHGHPPTLDELKADTEGPEAGVSDTERALIDEPHPDPSHPDPSHHDVGHVGGVHDPHAAHDVGDHHDPGAAQ